MLLKLFLSNGGIFIPNIATLAPLYDEIHITLEKIIGAFIYNYSLGWTRWSLKRSYTITSKSSTKKLRSGFTALDFLASENLNFLWYYTYNPPCQVALNQISSF